MAAAYYPPTRVLYVPSGLLMLFFGGFLVRPALLLLSFCVTTQLAYDLLARHTGPLAAAGLALLAGTGVLLGATRAVRRAPNFLTGGLLGACVGLSLGTGQTAAVAVLAPAFGLVFELVPREVGVFFSSYGGAYMLFYGMQLIDSQVFDGTIEAPAFVDMGDVDMWFSVLSFLVVGLLGCCVQLILYSGQAHQSASRPYYVDIP